MGKQLWKSAEGRSRMLEAEIHAKLEKELEDHLRVAPINPLIGMPGKPHIGGFCVS